MRLTGADGTQTGAAWLCGARFDMVFAELKKGNIRPSMVNATVSTVTDAVKSVSHGEL